MVDQLIHYQAANVSYEQTKKNFVVRKEDFEKVISDIKTSEKDSSFQHYVFVGKRGSGKSTLLRRIEAEIKTTKKLDKALEVVNLGEEQSGIYKIYDLWDYVIRDLNAKGYNIEAIDFREYKNDLNEYTRKLHSQIITAIRAKKKKRLILLIDNIERILKNIGSDNDLLRELLMNFLDIRIIGGSTFMSEHFWKYDQPFYQFFTIRHLEALNLKEINTLLCHWSEVKNLPQIKEIVKNFPGKLQSIRMLTDGTPRTMLIFVEMLLNKPALKGYDYLKVIVDKATPIYQERLRTLSPAQNKVLTELAFCWEATKVENLIQKCNLEGKTISALLNQLHNLRYVEKLKGKTKNLLYRIEERFFNLWLIMTQGGPQQKLEAKYLTNFLETWYDKKEKLKTDINKYDNNLSQVNKELLTISYLLKGDLKNFEVGYNKVTKNNKVETISPNFISELLIHQQHNLTKKLFEENEILIEKYKPLYYATLKLINTDESIDLKIMPELKENVEDILKTIKEERAKFQ